MGDEGDLLLDKAKGKRGMPVLSSRRMAGGLLLPMGNRGIEEEDVSMFNWRLRVLDGELLDLLDVLVFKLLLPGDRSGSIRFRLMYGLRSRSELLLVTNGLGSAQFVSFRQLVGTGKTFYKKINK